MIFQFEIQGLEIPNVPKGTILFVPRRLFSQLPPMCPGETLDTYFARVSEEIGKRCYKIKEVGYCAEPDCPCHTDPAWKVRTPFPPNTGPAYCCLRCARSGDGLPRTLPGEHHDQD